MYISVVTHQDGHGPPSMNVSPFGGRRRRGEVHSRGGFHRFYDQHHQQDMTPPEMNHMQSSYDNPILNDGIQYDYHHGEFPLPESTPGDPPNDQEDYYGREPMHRGFHGSRGVFSPHRYPSPHGDDR